MKSGLGGQRERTTFVVVNGLKGDYQHCVVERIGRGRTRRISRPSTASVSVSSHLDFVWSLDSDGFGRESEVDGAQLFLTLNKIIAQSHLSTSIPSPSPPKALWRWASDKATGVGTLEVVAANLHTGGSGHVVVIH